ncbi:MAG: 1,4-dihydroxy-2-naphthoate polyprenyltransferase [Candidatus Marinimicrobia bacterium]|jgi:1,4-dihydroxy-2-naphthoate octaprenyltransferase|nr:1,4-dihydroxy-2-naphthoate polyprenyltransferase [Candidatus Neomarinimicrobiota bacterium]
MNKWILASRLKTLPAAISPVIVGVSLAIHDGDFHLFTAVMTLLAAVLIQIGANFANDVYDFLKGSDREDRLGPTRATQSGLISPEDMKNGMWLVFSLAILVGFYLAWIGGWPIVWIGLASIASAIAYTGGPYPLGYHGWGDLFVFLFFGIIAVSGTYFLQTGVVSNESILFGIPLGALSTAILIVNNLRDADTDVKSGKRTLAVRFGKSFVKIEYIIMMVIAFAIPIYILQFWNEFSLYIILFLLPISIRLTQSLYFETGESLNFVLIDTAKFLFHFSILLSIGLIL